MKENTSVKILKSIREYVVYNYFTELTNYLSKEEIKKLVDSLVEYLNNDEEI